ncbi:hypothetical protein Clacol_001889 [Clathrus columnatus]|uniref:Transcription elongation factor Eaf N-terminal domain-containing protein n=1 Tax=Clathrus columnatus TaxID=1419009 RepID=A0AAV5A342_9AGAM|nr:hypothetical protein Clacol_001889 [Clathrus columnatus]
MSVNNLEDLTGRYGVTIGQSLINAWNERNGKPTKRAKGYPNPEFYSLRYSFKPESIDNESPGVLKPKSGEGHTNTQYELERPGTKGGSHRFSAVEQPSKEWECILLWDPETRTLKLERLESTLNLTFEGQTSAPASGSGSTNNNNRNGKGKGKAAALPPATAPVVNKRQEEDEIDEITKALMEELDAEGEKDDDVDLEALLVGPPSRKEEEEEVESETDVLKQKPPPPPPPLPPPPVQQPKAKATAKSSPKVQKAPKAPPKPKPKAKPKASAATTTAAAPATTNTKKEKEKEKEKGREKEKEKEVIIPQQAGVTIDDPDEEEMTFGQPSRPVVKRNNHSEPNPLANSGLALPTLPSQTPPVRHTQPTPSDLLQPPSSSINHIQYESDSDPDVMQEGEALNDVDEDLFAHEMEMVLADDDGDGEDDEELEPVPIESNPTASGRLLSLNELVGVNGTDNSDDDDDDDDTSSDDSDD